ncbi:MAG: PTS system mannose/fructose/sorbose family transporter subunit IID [Tissierellales bacterium]|jgi:mannose/fructose/N-acetylgalactosamine-specific phosphotransferase system component IID|nr:PTS system mannose/fructose/sorbose family transporter subunit IID [Tissierellales bacterium]
MSEVKLTKKDLNKCWRSWMMHNLTSMSFEFLESFGFCWSMVPAIKKLYANDPDKQREALKRHSAFYNTEPQLGAIVNGIAVGLEEKKANGEEVDGETINAMKVGLMGPLAGIGDSMIPGMLVPLLLSIGMGLAAGGSVLGPLFYIIAYNAIILGGSYFLFHKGYQLGAESVELLVGEKATKIKEAFSILGITVMGGVAASYVNLSTILNYQNGNVNLVIQDMIDGIFPKLLPLSVVIISWFLMSKKNVSPTKLMMLLLGVAVVGSVLGVF